MYIILKQPFDVFHMLNCKHILRTWDQILANNKSIIYCLIIINTVCETIITSSFTASNYMQLSDFDFINQVISLANMIAPTVAPKSLIGMTLIMLNARIMILWIFSYHKAVSLYIHMMCAFVMVELISINCSLLCQTMTMLHDSRVWFCVGISLFGPILCRCNTWMWNWFSIMLFKEVQCYLNKKLRLC